VGGGRKEGEVEGKCVCDERTVVFGDVAGEVHAGYVFFLFEGFFFEILMEGSVFSGSSTILKS
jgi:hypothetical protein